MTPIIFGLDKKTVYYLCAAAVLVIVGSLDDRFDLGVKFRFLAQIIAAAIMCYSGVCIETLGNLLGFGVIELGLWAVPFTIFATLGIVNAFNMIDGIDGLAGGLTLVALAALAVLALQAGQNPPLLLLLLACALLPYLIFNLGLPGGRGHKVFLGDAGSMLLGFTLVWLFVELSQQDEPILAPVTALWLVAVPLLDTLAIMARRLGAGLSPFQADRRHLHYILAKYLLIPRILYLMLTLSMVMAMIGSAGWMFAVPNAVLFYPGLLLLVIYYRLLAKPRRLLSWLGMPKVRQQLARPQLEQN